MGSLLEVVDSAKEAPETDKIYGFQFVTGQMVISKIYGDVTEDSSVVLLDTPYSIEVRQVPDGMRMGLTPANPFSKDGIMAMTKSSIVYSFSPDDKIVESYLNAIRKTETGLIVPQKSLIIS